MFEPREQAAREHTVFVPVLLLALTLVCWLGFQTSQLVAERQQLAQMHAAQQTAVDNATKLRASLEAIATGTNKLADEGDANARLVVEELRRRGIAINPPAAAKTN